VVGYHHEISLEVGAHLTYAPEYCETFFLGDTVILFCSVERMAGICDYAFVLSVVLRKDGAESDV